MNAVPGIRPRRSLSRRALFSVATAVLVLLCGELLSRGVLWVLGTGQWRNTQEGLAAGGMDDHDIGNILHPYVGTAYDPNVHPGHVEEGHWIPINRLGFADADDPVQHRSPDRLIIGVLGGSVAWHLSSVGEQRLKEVIRSDPRYQDREIVVVSLAVQAGKQPQQVMAVNYVQTLGGEFDVLVSLDGFNEVVQARDNYRMGVFAAYPRMWIYRVGDRSDGSQIAEYERLDDVRAARQTLARGIYNSWFRGSALRQVAWKVQDMRLEREGQALIDLIETRQDQEQHSFERLGPHEPDAPDDVVYARCVDIWANGSVQLQALAEFHDITYIHALQPNQYVSNAKPIGADEARVAIDDTCFYCETVRRGYPLLRERGERLRERGIRFVDLTMVFENVEEPLYIDVCCHLNQRGNDLLAERIGREILSALEADGPDDPDGAGR